MVMYCCAWNCTESYVKGGKITFHSFPANEERRKEWVRNVRRENFVPSKHTKICSKHFTEDPFDREKFGGHWLKATAVPTLFDFPHHLLCKEKKRKSPLKRKCSEENVEPVFSSVPHSCDPVPSAVVSEVVSFPLNEDSKLTTPLKPSKKYRYVGDFTEEDMNSPTKVRKYFFLLSRMRREIGSR
ncbi:THAP domain-containing protein 2-like [Ischnura elegans]|uniref:THAP domain-containing protein 2-like n=1 Tax=Ischnura elegans TaxID=197161 RepID=UPI001ED86E0C|nr:THAP domain-containing protein 2-like [Ischnura elegans]